MSKKRDQIIVFVKKRNIWSLQKIYKFGIKMSKAVKEALDVDRKNGDTIWADAFAKALNAIEVVYRMLEGDEAMPNGY